MSSVYLLKSFSCNNQPDDCVHQIYYKYLHTVNTFVECTQQDTVRPLFNKRITFLLIFTNSMAHPSCILISATQSVIKICEIMCLSMFCPRGGRAGLPQGIRQFWKLGSNSLPM